MKKMSLVFAAAAMLAVGMMSSAAEARPYGRSSFGFYSPGFSLYIGPRPYYGYRSYGYGYPYYGHRSYSYYRRPPAYSYRRSPSRCGHWSNRCARNWGRGNSNYYGCLRYHGCR